MFVDSRAVNHWLTDCVHHRTSRFATLGFSLSNLLDINNPQDLLRGLFNTMEYDQSKEDNEKPKMVSTHALDRGL